MKQLYILVLLSLLATGIFAQRKTEFGLLLKTGSFTLPNTYDSKIGKIKSGPGYSVQYGLYGKRNIGKQLAISTGLIYQYASVSKQEHAQIPLSSGAYTNVSVDARLEEDNLIFPLNLHFKPAFWEKTSFYLGFAASINLHTESSFSSKDFPMVESDNSSQSFFYICDCTAIFPDAVERIDVYQSLPRAPVSQLLLGAGVWRKLSEHTSLGFELLVSARRNDHDCQLELGGCCSTEVGYFSLAEGKGRYPVFMKSLAISLIHNILR